MWESQIERDFLYLLEFDTDVLSFREQPVEIMYAYETKKSRYYPDFYVERNSCKELVEIKPSSKLNDMENKMKFIAGEEYCRKIGWTFRVVTDEQIREGSLLENVKLLSRYAAVIVPVEFQMHAEALVKTNGCKIRLDELIAQSQANFGRVAVGNIYSLLYHQSLYADLKKPLSGQTAITLSKEVD